MKTIKLFFLLSGLSIFIWNTNVAPQSASAFSPDQPLSNVSLELRAQELHEGLRCLVCQGQSIADSNSELARDLRVLVRERINEGYTDNEVMSYLTDRYGDFILMDPPVKGITYVLWFGPLVALLIGGIAVYILFRRARSKNISSSITPNKPLSEEEKQKLKSLLQDSSE